MTTPADINRAVETADPLKDFKKEAVDTSKKSKKKGKVEKNEAPKELVFKIPLSASGQPAFPKEFFTLEFGAYETPRDVKTDGFQQIGIVRVNLGIPLPDGTRQRLGFWDHKLEVGKGKRMKLISPMSSTKEGEEETPADKLYSIAGVFFRDQLFRIIRKMIKEGKAQPVSALWGQTQNFKPVIYDGDLGGAVSIEL